MKRTVLLSAVVLTTLFVNAQSEKYLKAMQQWVPAVDTTESPDALLSLANTFQRIADAEKTQWLPYYYAALCQVSWAYMTGGENPSASVTDPVADKATELLKKAEALSGPDSDVFCLKKMIATLYMMPDPQNRFMTYGPIAGEALAKAKQLDPGNPRVYMLEAQDKFYTPPQFGGSTTEAKALFEESLRKFETHKPASDIHPSWGKRTVQYFLTRF